MNIRTVKKTEQRVETIPLSSLGIQSYGANNLYPQEILRLVASSESASTCMDRYKSFIQGNGFADITFSETTINQAGETADDILQLITADMADFRGFAIHINYNALCQIAEISHIPFENCRLAEPDTNGNITQIAIHPDWTGNTKRAGKLLRVNKENIEFINTYNPRKETIQAQIQQAGGIENYKGQILWISEEGKQTYPKPVHDAVISQMSTEEGLGNIANRNTRNNFQPSGMLITKKGADTSEYEADNDDTSISDAIAAIQGDTNTNKILHFEIEHDEEKPEFTNFQGNNYDKDYEITTKTASQKIYAAFNQEIWYRILNGSIGFSSQILRDAYEYYSTVTGKERRSIERAFTTIFKHWHEIANTSENFEIQPLKFISSDTTNNSR